MHAGNVMSVGSNSIFHRVIREEINGCVGCGSFAVYVDFKVKLLSDNEKVNETYTAVAFTCGLSFMFVCIWFASLLTRLVFVRLVSYMIKMSSAYIV